ncbi:hypothetical protein CapIbe_000242 [Capra ibex]
MWHWRMDLELQAWVPRYLDTSGRCPPPSGGERFPSAFTSRFGNVPDLRLPGTRPGMNDWRGAPTSVGRGASLSSALLNPSLLPE